MDAEIDFTLQPSFLQCFSSVVGPNGSGKSNVIDAMLFVFGKKAKQVMPWRGQPLSDNALDCLSPAIKVRVGDIVRILKLHTSS